MTQFDSELVIDTMDRDQEVRDLFDAIGISYEDDAFCANVLRVDGLDTLLIEETLTEHGIEFQWGEPDDNWEEDESE